MRVMLLALGLVATACGAPGDRSVAGSTEGCADVIDVSVTPRGDGTYSFATTIRSADTGWDKYADAFEVVAPDGTVLGTRELLHPHVDEQPFTRSLSSVGVPDGVETVTVRARDSVDGFCGATVDVRIPR